MTRWSEAWTTQSRRWDLPRVVASLAIGFSSAWLLFALRVGEISLLSLRRTRSLQRSGGLADT
jgi:hypothetical protein